jgi:molybdopterin-binding protein
MRKTGAPMLFAAPLPPVWVPRSRPLVLGRSADCDLCLPSKRASRRHAEVEFVEENVVVRDLKSTNGTRVNGEELSGPRILIPGDRIEIGGVTVSFCIVDDSIAFDDNCDATVSFEKPPLRTQGEEAFRGDLAEIPAAAVLQMLAAGGKTGVLSIVTENGTAKLWLAEGKAVAARVSGLDGIDAAYTVCGLIQGRFLFAPDLPPPQRTFEASVTELLLEASRKVDESLA